MSHDKPSEYYSLPGGRVMMEEKAENILAENLKSVDMPVLKA